jgi:hypothetical protein
MSMGEKKVAPQILKMITSLLFAAFTRSSVASGTTHHQPDTRFLSSK